MSWAQITSKKGTENVRPTQISSNTQKASMKANSYENDFPSLSETNNKQPLKPQKSQAEEIKPVTALLQELAQEEPVKQTKDEVLVAQVEIEHEHHNINKYDDNNNNRERKPFNYRQDRNYNKPHDQSTNFQSEETDRHGRKFQDNNNRNNFRQERSNQDGSRFQHDNKANQDRPKYDFQARKAEEESQLNERFKGEKENLCFTVQNGDLFQVHENVSLAHCVSADMEMSKGIAVEFKNRFSRVDELLSHHPRIGKCYYLFDKQRIIFYLVTKPKYYHKPSYRSLEESLRNLRELCERFKVSELAIPKIGCGLDQLDWKITSRIIDQVFENSPIKLTVYLFEKEEQKQQDN